MSGFWDAECKLCSKKFGWFGPYSDRPPCPSCGHSYSKEELEEKEKGVMKLMEDAMKQYLKDHPEKRGRL